VFRQYQESNDGESITGLLKWFSAIKIFIFALKNLVLPRNAGSSMGQACPALRESEIDGSALGFCV